MAYPHLFGPSTRDGVVHTRDGAKLPWQVFGKPNPKWPAVVCVNGLGCSTFFWHYVAHYFRTQTEVLIWDYRGHGDSPVPEDLNTLTVPQCADDLHDVMEEARVREVLLIGHSMGVQVILEYYRRHPDRVTGLVPLLGTYGNALDTFFNTSLVKTLFPAAYVVATAIPGAIQFFNRQAAQTPLTIPLASLTSMINGSMIRKSDITPYLANLAALDMRVFFRLARDMGVHSALDVLPNVRVPTLVMGGEKDIYTPLWLSQKMHQLIPHSEMLIIPGGSHAALVEQPELINLRLEKFIRERVLQSRPESATARELDQEAHSRISERPGR